MALILTPAITLVRGDAREFLVTTSDTNLASWVAAALTIRVNPNDPRYFNVPDDQDIDLSTWAVVFTLTNFAIAGATTYTFTATRTQMSLLSVGRRRCVLDTCRTDAGFEYTDVRPTWVDVVSPVHVLT